MSSINNTHKINGNLIVSRNNLSSNKSSKIVTATQTQQSKTLTSNLHRNETHPNYIQEQERQLQISYNSVNAGQQQHSVTKLQSPQQHSKRSLIPFVTLQQQLEESHQNQRHQQQQHSSITILTAATSNVSVPTQANQLQTIATIHQPSSQALQRNAPSTTESNNSTQITSATPKATALKNSVTRRTFHHLQTLKSAANSLKAPAHSIPPRYQPPPHPQSNSNPATVILKNLNTQQLTSSSNSSYSPYFTSELAGTNINNLKYPPDIPQLSGVLIPDSIKNSLNSTHFLHTDQNSHQVQQKSRSANQTTTTGHSSHQTNDQQQHHQDMLKFVRKSDQDHPSPNASVASSGTGNIQPPTGHLTAEQNRQLQSLINELRCLKDTNQRLMDDNQELRDLCCFLDDDRQKGRKLAREWQRFGRYTASVMRQEVSSYQNKLRQLDNKQQELITDNLELKELCLYLDEERAHISSNSLCANCGASSRDTLRDDGDGSSLSTNTEENMTGWRNYERQIPDLHLRSTLQDQTLQYVLSLERRILQLEKERNDTSAPSKSPTATENLLTPLLQRRQTPSQQQPSPHLTTSIPVSSTHTLQSVQPPTPLNDDLTDPASGRPEAVVRALQVLEVREQLERDRLGNLTGQTIDQMDDGEKALVREMCNVVWRKLEGSPNEPSALDTL